jgi:hypothetical protein
MGHPLAMGDISEYRMVQEVRGKVVSYYKNESSARPLKRSLLEKLTSILHVHHFLNGY